MEDIETSAQPKLGATSMDPVLIQQYINDILDVTSRDNALAELSRCRETFPDLAVLLWDSYGTYIYYFESINHLFFSIGVVTVLLQEILGIYNLLSPPALTSQASTRVCNALALMQCLASHEATRYHFLQGTIKCLYLFTDLALTCVAQIPLYLYPCLSTTSKARPFEYLRLTCLGVIGALVKNEDGKVIEFLLSTEIIPLCLRIMETGNELSRTVAIFILQKILLDRAGLEYVCQTYERFFAIVTVLNNMVFQLQEQQPSLRLLKHIVRCYLRLSEHKKALEGLKQALPAPLRDGTFDGLLKEDPMTCKFAAELLLRVAQPPTDVLLP